MQAPCIFVLESDDNARPALKHNLQYWGYQVIMALDEEDALQRIQTGQTHFDLILLNQNGCSLNDMMVIGRQLCQSTEQDAPTPILVTAERYGADLEGKTIQVSGNEYVTYLEDGEQLKRILRQLCPIKAG